MRLSIVAGLLLSPSLLHAQTGTPASSPLEARLASPSALVSAASSAAPVAATSSTSVVRVSTGVVAPQLIHSVPLAYTPVSFNLAVQHQAEMVVDLSVNEKGEPVNVRVAKSVDAALDPLVVEAVRQYRFRPATLDSQPVAIDVALKVVFQK